MAIKIRSIAALRKETLETINSQDTKEIGTLLLSLVEEIENLHTELGIDQTLAGEDGSINFEHKLDDGSNLKNDYESLLQEYKNRFSGEYNNAPVKNNPTQTGQNTPSTPADNEPKPLDIFFEQEGE